MRCNTLLILVSLAIIILSGCVQTPEKCKEHDSKYSRDKCTYKIALKTEDSRLCRAISEEEIADKPIRSGCYYEIAVRTLNPELCKKIGHWYDKKACLEKIYEKTKNPGVCFLFEDYIYEKEISERAKNYCLSTIGEEKEDASMCVLSEDSDCLHTIAKETNNSFYCQMINDPLYRHRCHEHMNSYLVKNGPKKINLEYCQNDALKAECYLEMIKRLKKPEACQKINETDVRNRCYFNVIKNTKN